MIVIEGIDNSGKSTLARHIAAKLGFEIQESEGPPKSQQEINWRIQCYDRLKATVMVRHPVISESIYQLMRTRADWVLQENKDKFYARKPLLIYCDPLDHGLGEHIVKAHDSAEHLAALEANYAMLLQHYRTWAIKQAHLMYRIGDDLPQISDIIVQHEITRADV